MSLIKSFAFNRIFAISNIFCSTWPWSLGSCCFPGWPYTGPKCSMIVINIPIIMIVMIHDQQKNHHKYNNMVTNPCHIQERANTVEWEVSPSFNINFILSNISTIHKNSSHAHLFETSTSFSSSPTLPKLISCTFFVAGWDEGSCQLLEEEMFPGKGFVTNIAIITILNIFIILIMITIRNTVRRSSTERSESARSTRSHSSQGDSFKARQKAS